MAIDLLCEVIAQSGKVSAAAYRQSEGYASLIDMGLLNEGGIIQSIACLECDCPHDAEVVHFEGRYGYWCPDLGFVPVEEKALTGLSFDLPSLVKALASVFACKRRKSTPLHGSTWRVGAVETPQGDLTIYFHATLVTGQDARDAEFALAAEIKSAFTVVLTAVGALNVSGTATARLSDIVDLDLEAGALIPVVDLATMVGASPKRQSGAPNIFGQQLKTIIVERARRGEALTGRNDEASAVLDAFRRAHPGKKIPSLSYVKRHVTKVRHGS